MRVDALFIFVLAISIASTIGLAYVSTAQGLEIGGDDEGRVVNLETEEETATAGGGGGGSNLTSAIANATYLLLDASNDPVTDSLTIQGGNGRIISTNAGGGLRVDTSGGAGAGYISFGNTADIGISTDGVEGNNWDSDGTLVFKQKASNPDSFIEFVFIEEGGDFRFALPSSGPNAGTYNPRSFIIAGPANNNDTDVLCSSWGADSIDCNTSQSGADLFIQDDLEVEGQVFIEIEDQEGLHFTLGGINISSFVWNNFGSNFLYNSIYNLVISAPLTITENTTWNTIGTSIKGAGGDIWFEASDELSLVIDDKLKWYNNSEELFYLKTNHYGTNEVNIFGVSGSSPENLFFDWDTSNFPRIGGSDAEIAFEQGYFYCGQGIGSCRIDQTYQDWLFLDADILSLEIDDIEILTATKAGAQKIAQVNGQNSDVDFQINGDTTSNVWRFSASTENMSVAQGHSLEFGSSYMYNNGTGLVIVG